MTADALHAFKNFHRLLCERFGYSHDDKDWLRDQISLIEFIAAKIPAPAEGDELRDLLIRAACVAVSMERAGKYTSAADAADAVLASNPQPKGMPAEWLDAFEEWRQTLGAADLDGKRDLVWRHIAGTGFQAGAAWARSQAPAPAHDRKAQALALCHALEEQPGSQYQTAAVLAAFKVYRAFESIEKHGEIRQWVFDVAAPCAAVGAEPVGHVTSFGDIGCTCDYVSPQKYRPPVGAPLYAAPPDHTAAMRQAYHALRFAVNNQKATQELHEACVVPQLEPAIAALRAALGESHVPVQGSQS